MVSCIMLWNCGCCFGLDNVFWGGECDLVHHVVGCWLFVVFVAKHSFAGGLVHHLWNDGSLLVFAIRF